MIKDGVGPAQANYRLRVLSLLFTWMRQHGLHAGDNPVARTEVIKEPAKRGIWRLEQLRELVMSGNPQLAMASMSCSGPAMAASVRARSWTSTSPDRPR